MLYLIGQLGTGGSERQLGYLLQAMDRKTYPAVIVVWNNTVIKSQPDWIHKLDVPVITLGSNTSSWQKVRRVRQLVLDLRPEVVHSYSFFTNYPAYLSCLKTQSIAIGSLRGEFIESRRLAGFTFGRLSARWPKYQIYNNSFAYREARNSRDGYVPKFIAVIRNGLDLERFSEYPISNRPVPRLLGIGSLCLNKRWDRMLRIASFLARKGTQFRLSFAGEGPLRRSLHAQARNLGIDDRVCFLGNVQDVAARIRQASIVVHCSDHEGCPNAIMEAMACARAVVATETGDVPFLVQEGETGFVVPPESEVLFAERVSTLLSNRRLCIKMGLAGREKAKREFGLDRLVADTMTAYEKAGWRKDLCVA